MEFEIIIHKDQKYVEVITIGIADKSGSLSMAKTLSQTMRQNKITRAMVDHSQIEEVTGQIFDIYERPKLFSLIGVILGIRIAEVIKPEHSEHFAFFETVCLNRGYKFSVFHDRNSALDWLLNR